MSRELIDEIMGIFGWCICANPYEAVETVAEYLMRVEEQETGQTRGLLDMIIAYDCDRVGLTEHGNSVFFCWLTNKGKDLLEKIKASYQEKEEKCS